MSTLMEDDIKRWTAKRKTALVLDIIQGKTTVAEASRAYDPVRVKVVVAHFMQPIAVYRDSTGFLRPPHRAQG